MVSRRSLLRGLAASLVAGVAGCNALGGAETDTDPGEPVTPATTRSPVPTSTPTATLTPVPGTAPSSPTESGSPSPSQSPTGTSTIPRAVATPAMPSESAVPGSDDPGAELGRAVGLADDVALFVADHGATVFERRERGWARATTLRPPDRDDFGRGVSATLAGDTAVVGGPSAGPEGADDYSPTGAVFRFARGEDGWRQRHRLTAPGSGGERDDFGRSVAADGERIVVGDVSSGGPETTWEGTVHVFRRRTDEWTHETTLATGEEDLFGSTVAVDGDTVLVGVPAARLDGGTRNAVYVYRRSGGRFQREAVLAVDDTSEMDGFGASLALAGDVAVVGNPEAGRAYAFERAGGEWVERARVGAPRNDWTDYDGGDDHDGSGDGDDGGAFGAAVALGVDVAVVGAPGVGPSYTVDPGRAYLLDREDWHLRRVLVPDEVSGDAHFGTGVALDGAAALVSAPGTGAAGRGYLFDL